MNRWVLDFDSVLNDFNAHICNTLMLRYGYEISPSEITEWEFWDGHKYESAVWGPTMFLNREWTLNIPTKRSALSAIHRLRERGDDMIVVSDRPDMMHEWVAAWLELHGFEDLPLFLTNKVKTKLEIGAEHGCNIAIDDSPHWLDSYANAPEYKRVYIMDTPYNRFVEESDRMVRVGSWNHLIVNEGVHVVS